MMISVAILAFCIPTLGADEYVWVDDPSAMPRVTADRETYGNPIGERFETNRKRLLIDFDGDGIRDLLLDIPISYGTGGRGYVVYLANEDGKYRYHSNLTFRHGISIETFHEQRWVWYETGSGSSSTLVYQAILEDGLGEAHTIELREWWEDGVSSPFSKEIILAVFGNSAEEGQWEVGNLIDEVMVWKPPDSQPDPTIEEDLSREGLAREKSDVTEE